MPQLARLLHYLHRQAIAITALLVALAGSGYAAFTLPANSLTWNTTGSSWTSAAPRPAYQCSLSPFCFIDHATATKVVSAATTVALGTWTSSGVSTLSLATPANLRKLNTNEVYRVDVIRRTL